MASKREITAKAKQLGVDMTNPVKVTALVSCVAGAAMFTSLPNAIKKCAKKLHML